MSVIKYNNIFTEATTTNSFYELMLISFKLCSLILYKIKKKMNNRVH